VKNTEHITVTASLQSEK